MAARLLPALLGGVCLFGCLVPQDDNVLFDLPPQRNSPPRVVVGQTQPQQVVTLLLGDGCRQPSFEAKVEDPDLKDVIRNRWFIDPNGTHTSLFTDGQPLPESLTSIRSSSVKMPTTLFTASPLATAGTHVIELLIADGELSEGAQPFVRTVTGALPDGGRGTLTDQSYVDTYQWFVTTDLKPCPVLP